MTHPTYHPSEYRPAVGIVLFNKTNQAWYGRRSGHNKGPYMWQFPQGGIDAGEMPLEAAYRELWEETGALKTQVTLMGEIKDWLYYDLPAVKQKRWRGQKQKWFAFRFHGEATDFDLEAHGVIEFSDWRWAPLMDAPDLIVPFKQDVYKRLTAEFSHFTHPDS